MKSPHHREKRNLLPFEFFLAEGYCRTGGMEAMRKAKPRNTVNTPEANTRLLPFKFFLAVGCTVEEGRKL